MRYPFMMQFNRKIQFAIVAVMTACLGASVKLLAGDWPQWGGEPGRNMVSAEKDLPETFRVRSPMENVRWSGDSWKHDPGKSHGGRGTSICRHG